MIDNARDRPPRVLLPLEGSRDFDDLVHLDLIALLDVVVALHRQAALEAGLHFAHVVLEALERVELPIVDDYVVAENADFRTAPDQALEHVAAGNRPNLGDL